MAPRRRTAAVGAGALGLAAIVLSLALRSYAGTGDPDLVITGVELNPLYENTVHLYGASLSQNWAGVPPRLAVDWVNSSWLERLDDRYPVYIDWEMSAYVVPGGCGPCSTPDPTTVVPPRPLANEPWFIGHQGDFVPSFNLIQNADPLYRSCGPEQTLEEPLTTPLSLGGRMRVKDIHGGLGGEVIVGWARYQCLDSVCEWWIFAVHWNRVQTYRDEDTGLRSDPLPGQTVTRPMTVHFPRAGCAPCLITNLWSEMFVTEWVSTDVGTTASSTVDASDLAALAAEMGQPVRWGYDPPLGDGPASRNDHLNFYPFDAVIDARDLTQWAVDQRKRCGSQVAGPAERLEDIMTWFGCARTGRAILLVPGQPAVPEWELVDRDQSRRAIADAYGYRAPFAPGLARLPWGRVKQLYR